jgi:hypothetical protein
MIKVTIDWAGKKGLDNLIRYIENNAVYGEAQEAVRLLGHHTADSMRSTINNERRNPKRPDDKLVNAITAETLNTTGGIEVGIGRIAKLVAEAPYFELINDGGTYITKKTHVVPTTYFGDPGDGFVTFKEGSTHSITGIDYVGKAIRNLDKELRDVMEKLGSKFLGGAANSSK